MQAANCKPDVISYNSALGALDRAGKGKEERVTWAAKKSAGLGNPCVKKVEAMAQGGIKEMQMYGKI